MLAVSKIFFLAEDVFVQMKSSDEMKMKQI